MLNLRVLRYLLIKTIIKILFEIDDQLPKIIFERFTGQKKTKEEQIKFILRKCFKFLKQ